MLEKKVQTKPKIILLTPVWNDSGRLASFGEVLAGTLAASSHDVHWVIADDGSGDDERARLKKLHRELLKKYACITLFFAEKHQGKGGVVHDGWAEYSDADWLGFVDADGSLPPLELMRMIDAALDKQQSVLGVRKRTKNTDVQLSVPRLISHRLFIFAVKMLVGVRCSDPQCGAKLLKGDDYRSVADDLQEKGLAFDSELLVALAGSKKHWLELPVTWTEKNGGKVCPFRNAWGMLAALWKIRIRQRNGELLMP